MQHPTEDAPGVDSTDIQAGLSTEQVARLLAQHGPNEIPEREESFLRRLLRRFWGPIPWMIEVAAVLSAIVQKWEDFSIILVLLLVNVCIDFRQEAKALGALKVLKEKLARRAIVRRDGVWQEVAANRLVPGDIVKLRIGAIVPADVRLVEGEYLEVDQSALTGESLPVDLSVGDECHANAIVKKGEMIAQVIATGADTYFGKTVALVARADREQRSHFQQAVIRVGNFLIVLAVAMVGIILMTSLARGDSLMEIVRFSLVLTIASIPVALPAVLSVTMAVGAVKLARHKVIVSRLVAIEELAGVNVLCCDKTGTLTQNRMKLGTPATFNGFDERSAIHYAVMASRAEDHDPLEAPLFEADASIATDGVARHVPDDQTLEHFTPFDPVSKRTEARYSDGTVVTKGAPQVVLALCEDEPEKDTIKARVADFAERGERTLAVAIKPPGSDTYRFVGVIPFSDPPREDSERMIRQTRALGVDIKMVTGDNLAIATQIARVLGLEGQIRDITELKDQQRHIEVPVAEAITESLYSSLKPGAKAEEIGAARRDVIQRIESKLKSLGAGQRVLHHHESEILRIIESSAGFAQVFPEDKYLIVQELQRAGRIVGMTGDGVNDAPALRKADVGIAVSGATDAARAASDVVLLLPGLGVIVEAIGEARRIFSRMQSYAIFRIAETIRVILFMTLAITLFNFYPVTAVMIIILAMLNDIPILAIAYDNARADDEPVRWDMKEVLTVASLLGTLGVVSSFLVFFVLDSYGFSRDIIQSIIFLKLDVAGHSTIYVTRTRDKHFWHKPYPSLKFFIPAFSSRIIGTVVACFGILMTPIGWKYTAIIWVYATVWFVINDTIKVHAYRMLRAGRWFGRSADAENAAV